MALSNATPLQAQPSSFVPPANHPPDPADGPTAATNDVLATQATPLAPPSSPAGNSSSALQMGMPKAHHLDVERKLDSLLKRVNNLCEPGKLKFAEFKSLLARLRAEAAVVQLQSSGDAVSSLTIGKVTLLQSKLLAFLEIAAVKIKDFELPGTIQDCQPFFDDLGAFVLQARGLIFEDPQEAQRATVHLRTITNRLLDHLVALGTQPCGPKPLLAPANWISRCWKLDILPANHHAANRFILTFPERVKGWAGESLVLKDLGKCFEQMRSIMVFSGIGPGSPHGQVLRAVFNQMCNFLGKLSGYTGMLIDLDRMTPDAIRELDQTMAISVSSIVNAIGEATRRGYLEPGAAAPDLMVRQLEFLSGAGGSRALMDRLPQARLTAVDALQHLGEWTPAKPELSVTLTVAKPDDAVAADIATTTTTTTATTTTTSKSAVKADPAPGKRSAPQVKGAERRQDSDTEWFAQLRNATPATIGQVAEQGKGLTALVKATGSAEPALVMLFRADKAKLLLAIAGYKPFLALIVHSLKGDLLRTLDALHEAMVPRSGLREHVAWLTLIRGMFGPGDAVSAKIDKVQARVEDYAREHEARERESRASQAPEQARRRHPKNRQPLTSVAPTQAEPATPDSRLNDAALAALKLEEESDVDTFCECILAYAQDGNAPIDVRSLVIPLKQPRDDGSPVISLRKLIPECANTSNPSSVLDALRRELARLGVAGAIRPYNAATDRAPEPERTAPVESEPVEKPGGMSLKTAAGYLVASGIFGLGAGSLLMRAVKQMMAAQTPGAAHINPETIRAMFQLGVAIQSHDNGETSHVAKAVGPLHRAFSAMVDPIPRGGVVVLERETFDAIWEGESEIQDVAKLIGLIGALLVVFTCICDRARR